MVYFIGLIFIWILFGIAAAGCWVGYFNSAYPGHYREDLSSGIVWGCTGGPFSFLVGVFLSRCLRYGWRLTSRD